VIGDASRAEPGGERVPKLVGGEIRYARFLQRVRPDLIGFLKTVGAAMAGDSKAAMIELLNRAEKD
jgi:hypothetical protein